MYSSALIILVINVSSRSTRVANYQSLQYPYIGNGRVPYDREEAPPEQRLQLGHPAHLVR